MTETTVEHPNAALARRIFAAFARRDGAAVVAALDDDVVWRVGGASPVAGEYRGRREVIDFLRMTTQETGGTYRSELLWAVADDERAVGAYAKAGFVEEGRLRAHAWFDGEIHDTLVMGILREEWASGPQD